MMQLLKHLFSFASLFLIVASAVAANAQTRSGSNDTLMILPFENTSNMSEYNWVGESFAEGLTEVLARQELKVTGMRVVSNDERKQIQQRLRLPLTALPSLATSIKIAQQSRASHLVLGRYSVSPGQGEAAAELHFTARVVNIIDGTMVSEVSNNGKVIFKEIDIADALSELQKLQGQAVYQILLQRDKSLTLSRSEIETLAKQVPPVAFEAFIKGMLTPDGDARINYFKNAIRLYGKEKNNEIYAQAALELGHVYLRQNNFTDALDSFAKVPRTAPQFAEAAFYAGLMQWNLKNEELALAAFRALAEDAKLTTAYNNLGAVAAGLSRTEKDPANKTALSEEGLKFLSQAATTSPDDPVVKFNYGYALFAAGKYKEAIEQLRPVLVADQRDGQAYFLLSKAMEKTGDANAADIDNQARKFFPVYAKAQTEWQKSLTTNDIPFRLFRTFNRTEFRKSPQPDVTPIPNENDPENLLAKVRELFKAGRDDEALPILRRVLVADSMNAEAYLLIGSIHLRRGDLEPAISNLKTAIFWKNDLIEGHVALGKIFVERKDFQQAATYCQSARRILEDKKETNQEVESLCRQIERK